MPSNSTAMQESLKADYECFNDPTVLNCGVMIFEADALEKGRIVFSLDDLQPRKQYVTERGNELVRISNIEIRLKGCPDPIYVTHSHDPEERNAEIQTLSELHQHRENFAALIIQTVYRGHLARLKYKATQEEKRMQPRISNAFISGKSSFTRTHLEPLTSSYNYEGGEEGDSMFRWERAKCLDNNNNNNNNNINNSSNNNSNRNSLNNSENIKNNNILTWETIKGATQRTYQSNMDDVGYFIHYIVTPVREDWVKGDPVTSANYEIVLDNRIQEAVDANCLKRKILVDVFFCYGGRPAIPKTICLYKDRIEMKKRGSVFEEFKVKYGSSLLLAPHHRQQSAITITVQNKNEVQHLLNALEDEDDIMSYDGSDIIPQKSKVEFDIIAENPVQRDVLLLTIRERIEQYIKSSSNNNNNNNSLRDSNNNNNNNNNVNNEKEQYKLSEGDWELMLTNANELNYQRERVIIEQGVLNNTLYRIMSGTVKIVKDNSIILARLGVGAVFGEMSFIGNNVTTAAVIAEEEEVKVKEVDINFVRKVFDVEPLLALKSYYGLAVRLSERLRELHKPAEQLLSEEAPLISDTPNKSLATGSSSNNSTPRSSLDAAFASLSFSRKPTQEIHIKAYSCAHHNMNGTLYLYQNKLVFLCKVFALKVRKEYLLKDINHLESITRTKEYLVKLRVGTRIREKTFRFNTSKERDELVNLLTSLADVSCPVLLSPRQSLSGYNNTSDLPLSPRRMSVSDPGTGSGLPTLTIPYSPRVITSSSPRSPHSPTRLQMPSLGLPVPSGNQTLMHSPSFEISGAQSENVDWSQLLSEVAEKAEYPPGFAIIVEGHHVHQRLYQVDHGTCLVQRGGKTIAEMPPGSLFGEMSFLQRSPATASVVVSSSGPVDLHILDGFALSAMFTQQPRLGARFYKYLASILVSRLEEREAVVFGNIGSSEIPRLSLENDQKTQDSQRRDDELIQASNATPRHH